MSSFKEEIEKISKMDTQRKISYFKSYYLVPTVIILFLLMCFVSFLMEGFILRKEPIYSGGICSVSVSDEGREYLTTGFFEKLNGGKKEEVLLSEDLTLNFAEGDEYNYQASNAALYTFLVARDYNYLLMDGNVVEHIVDMDAFIDISDMVADYMDADTKCIYDKAGKLVAISLSDEVLKRAGISSMSGEVYFSIAYTGDDNSKDILFIDYLLGGK